MEIKLEGPSESGQDLSPPTRRVVAVIELLVDRPDNRLALADICRELGISRSTGHAILQTLCACGWAIRDPQSGRFSLGPAMARIWRQATPLHRILREPLQQFAVSIGMPVCMSEVRDGSIVVVDAATVGPAQPPVPAGVRLPFIAPFGREFVAWAPPADRTAWVDAAGPVNDVFRARIGEVLKEIKSRGYGIERLSDPLLRVYTALQALDDGFLRDPVSARLAAALAELTIIDVLQDEFAQAAESCALATISAPVFDTAGRVVTSVSAQPYRRLSAGEVRDVGAHVVEFACTAGTLIAQPSHSGQAELTEGY
jgi:DNA-binding IclR family transcriptional regulator